MPILVRKLYLLIFFYKSTATYSRNRPCLRLPSVCLRGKHAMNVAAASKLSLLIIS